jgi:hypothetical protein
MRKPNSISTNGNRQDEPTFFADHLPEIVDEYNITWMLLTYFVVQNQVKLN